MNEWVDMKQMTLPSRDIIFTSSPGGLRPSTISVMKAPHNNEYLRKKVWFFGTWMKVRGTHPRSPTFQEGSFFNHCTGKLKLKHGLSASSGRSPNVGIVLDHSSKTMDQQYGNIGSTSPVSWDGDLYKR